MEPSIITLQQIPGPFSYWCILVVVGRTFDCVFQEASLLDFRRHLCGHREGNSMQKLLISTRRSEIGWGFRKNRIDMFFELVECELNPC